MFCPYAEKCFIQWPWCCIERDNLLREATASCLMFIILCNTINIPFCSKSFWVDNLSFDGLKAQGTLLAYEVSSKPRHGVVETFHFQNGWYVILGGLMKWLGYFHMIKYLSRLINRLCSKPCICLPRDRFCGQDHKNCLSAMQN